MTLSLHFGKTVGILASTYWVLRHYALQCAKLFPWGTSLSHPPRGKKFQLPKELR